MSGGSAHDATPSPDRGGTVRPRWRDRFDVTLLDPVPAERLALVRIVVGAFVAVTAAGLLPSTLAAHHLDPSTFRPVGLLSPFTSMPPWPLTVAANALAIIAGLAVAFGFRHAISGFVAAIAFLWTASHRSSWGMVFHSENLLALHAVVIACAPAADALSWDARRRPSPAAPSERYGWSIVTMAIVTVATYFLAGVAKLRADGLGWAAGEFLRNQIAYDNVRKAELGAFHSPLAGALLAHPALFTPLATASLALETLAPLALLSWRTLRMWAVAIVGFHVGILILMAVAFPYPLTGAAFVGIFPVERLLRRFRTNG